MEAIKIIRWILVSLSTFAAANLTADFFNGLFIYAAGLCYDYYDWKSHGRKLSKIFGCVAFASSVLLFFFSALGVMHFLQLDIRTRMIVPNTPLLPQAAIDMVQAVKCLLIFPIFAGVEIFLGRNDKVDQ